MRFNVDVPHRLLFGLLIVGLVLATAGCNAVNQVVGTTISADSPTSISDGDLAVYQQYFSPAAVMDCIKQVRATPERRSCRDLITYARMRVIDINYERYRRKVFEEVNGGNAATDITVLGLNAAGTLVPSATTKSILAAISGGLVGAKGVIDKDVLYNAGIQTLILKMDADRAALRLRITSNLKQNEEVYPLEAAELDTGDYYRAGTLQNALITLQGDAGAALKTDTQIADQPPTAPQPSPPAAVAFSAATHPAVPPAPPAPAPAPPAAPPLLAPAPLVTPPPAPPPVVIAPNASAVVPTPPTPPPSLPETGIASAPQTPADQAFLAAVKRLKTDATGALTAESRQIIDACTAPFRIPARTLLSDIRRLAGGNLPAITACIAKPPRAAIGAVSAAAPRTEADRAFLVTVKRLKTDTRGALTAESRQVVDACTAPFRIPARTLLSDIRGLAGANLPAITACIAKH